MNNDLEHLQLAITNSLNGLDSAQTQLRPAPEKIRWSIQQIVEHLLLTYTATESAIGARLAKRTATRTRPGMLQHVSQYTVLRLGYFPPGRKAPVAVAPPAGESPLSGEALACLVRERLDRLDGLFHEAEELFGSVRCASHMVLGPLSIPQWRRFQLIHGGHHVKQILAIRKAHRV